MSSREEVLGVGLNKLDVSSSIRVIYEEVGGIEERVRFPQQLFVDLSFACLRVFQGVQNRKELRSYLAEVESQQQQLSLVLAKARCGDEQVPGRTVILGIPADLCTTRLGHIQQRLRDLSRILEGVVELPAPPTYAPVHQVQQTTTAIAARLNFDRDIFILIYLTSGRNRASSLIATTA
eukprot:8519864-Pyramimonas_sp.AAC.2